MRRDSKINQFIPLHFYEPDEKMPADDSKVILIYIKTGDTPTYYYTVMALYKEYGEISPRFYTSVTNRFIDPKDERIKIIAWATFNPGWVTGFESFPEKWGSQ